MSNTYRYSPPVKKQFPRPKRSIPLYGEGDDEGKYFRCWYCGQINNADKRPLAEGQTTLNTPVNADNMSLWLKFEGANLSTTFTDSGPTGHTVTANGNALISTARYKHGDSSGYFDGNGDCLNITDHDDFDFSDGEFSLSCWVNFNLDDITTSRHYLCQHQSSTGGNSIEWYLSKTSGGRPYLGFRLRLSSTTIFDLKGGYDSFMLNNWNHTELDESGDNYYLFVNGQQVGYISSTSRAADHDNDFYIAGVATLNEYKGYMDDFVVRKQAWHTHNFHPSTVDCYYPDPSSGCFFCGSPNYR